MVNERITEEIVREQLRKAGYYDTSDIEIYEQKTSEGILENLLDKASKNKMGKDKGYPDFILFLRQYDIVIIIECKADRKKHYIAIGVSGQNLEELRITKYFYQKKATIPFKIRGQDKELESPKEIYQYWLYEEKLEKIDDFEKISSNLHKQLHEANVSQYQKSIIIAVILLGLADRDFRQTYQDISSEETIATSLLNSMVKVLEEAEVSNKSIKTIKNNSLFLLDHAIVKKNSPYKLSYFIKQLDNKVFKYMKGDYKEMYTDELGYFYNEFLKYTGGGDGRGLGIVLTPFHICELFAELAGINKKSRVIDICAGTGGFLVAALKKMLTPLPLQKEIQSIKKNNIIGFELSPNIYPLLIANMIIRNDGKSNCLNIDCFSFTSQEIYEKYKPNTGLLNPPYAVRKKELEFVLHMLDSLEPRGIGIAIVNVSCCKDENDSDLRKEILSRHQLLGVMSMKNNLFRRSSGVNTNILVFRTHSKHKEKTFMAL
ncbi:13551_t:CDS:2 [Funneliformis geosporum]|uniref:site-specific DNA-methyltransferase (adenine-specific) n=1 Tax=Funneliformis geosporum TaxID=1117311 RepID=A0A9W4SBD9_9GLOM|nr:13551_t:CDS:2 [Funneliformis geosporum]